MSVAELETPIVVANRRATPITLYLEPWGDTFDMAPQSQVRITITSSSPPTLEFELAEGHAMIAVHGPSGALAVGLLQAVPDD